MPETGTRRRFGQVAPVEHHWREQYRPFLARARSYERPVRNDLEYLDQHIPLRVVAVPSANRRSLFVSHSSLSGSWHVRPTEPSASARLEVPLPAHLLQKSSHSALSRRLWRQPKWTRRC